MIKKVDHIGIAVRSIDEAMPLYRALGLEIERIEEVPAEKVRVAMIACGDTHLELLEPTADDSPIAKFLADRGPGIHHICLGSNEILADDARLREHGLRLLRPEPTIGAGGSLVQFVHPKSAGGMLLELSQPAP
jgi:methylmalonyl-CoA/ethylmalonyl-CoA epimerase